MKHTRFMIPLVLLLFVMVNGIGTLTLDRYRYDFTDDKRFSLSQGTRHILETLKEPITLRLFFSNQLVNGIPYVKTYAARVKSFLQEYAAYSHGNVTFEVIDPEPYSEAEDLALSYGLKGVPVNNQDGKAYFGLVATNGTDEVRTIPVFTFEREKFTEYELTRMIYDLAVPKKPTVGIISSLPIGEQGLLGFKTPGLMGSRAWIVVQQLQQVMNVKILPKDTTSIPEDVDVIMVVQPDKDTKDELFKAIDAFVIAGKPAMLFLDPHAESKGGSVTTDTAFDTRMEPLLSSWGVTLPRDKVVGDRLAARKVKDDTIKSEVDYIAWLAMHQSNINDHDITTAGLKTIHLGTSGFLAHNSHVATEILPLITSNTRAMRMDVQQVRGRPDPNRALEQFVSEEQAFTLAARIKGTANSAYNPKKQGHVNLVVVADSDILRDELWATDEKFEGYQMVRPIADNASFVVNTLDYLSGNSDLISLRGRGTAVRPFTRIDEIKRQSEEHYLTQRKALQERLNQTELRLANLQKQAKTEGADAAVYYRQQQAEIKQFTNDMTQVRKSLRQVRKMLYQKVDTVESWVKFINILLLPLLVTGIGLVAYRRAMKYSLKR